MADEDFPSSAARHLEDGFRLCEDGRFDNAQHLLGFAVECALKAVVEKAPLNPVHYRHNLRALSGDALDLAIALAPTLGRCRVPQSSVAVLGGWNESHRYRKTGTVKQQEAEKLAEAARHIYCETIVPLVLDGYLDDLP